MFVAGPLFFLMLRNRKGMARLIIVWVWFHHCWKHCCVIHNFWREEEEQICYWYYHTVGSYHTVVELGHKMTSCCPPLTDTVYSTVPLSRVRTRIDFFASRLTSDRRHRRCWGESEWGDSLVMRVHVVGKTERLSHECWFADYVYALLGGTASHFY